jgi:hypothetical protein
MPKIPKTLVVGINLHGEIQLDSNSIPQTEKVPVNYIVKLNTVSPGVPNISTFENYNELSDITKEYVKENTWLNDPMISDRLQENTYKPSILEFVKYLKEYMVEENGKNLQGIQKDYDNKRKQGETTKHIQNFEYNKDKMYEITEFNKGDTIVNKLFLKFTPEELEQLGIDEEEIQYVGFNKIVLYNFTDENDDTLYNVFDLIGPEYTQITLFQLIDLLKGMGAENLILIDLSCSVFRSSNNNDITERDERFLRRDIKKSRIFGGKRKTKKNRKSKKKVQKESLKYKKTKNRKSKK